MSNQVNSSNSSAIVQYFPLEQRPQDLLFQSLKRLNLGDIFSYNRTCKALYQQLKNNETIWQNLFYSHFPRAAAASKKITSFETTCKTLYSNLTKGVYALDTLEGHWGGVTSLVIEDDRLISASLDNTVKI